MNALIRRSFCLILALVFTAAQVARAQQTTPTAAPVPPQITEARSVFLSNAGADSFFLNYSGGQDRAYNDLYAAMKDWGRYKIVSSPAKADLILEVKSLAPVSDVMGGDDNASLVYNPQIRLQALDPQTRTVLWSLTAYVQQGPGLVKGRDRQFDLAAAGLFNQYRQLTGERLTAQEAKQTYSKPSLSRGAKIFLLVGLAAAALITGLFVYHATHQPKLTAPTLPACAPFCPVG